MVLPARCMSPFHSRIFVFPDHEPYSGDYRLDAFGDFIAAHKRVPSAGDMMVRFGKRSV
ncbi:unnamed protein product [Heligmosomoides polygyrus]|uniref:FHA domain-containing protein n=1 Tax=Heligmosomoides polygyrus TaxID=6339 RepID=A0A183G1A3_HELPZ|nr:unnamed protein product [Heligmosomoides polygyrus]